MFFVIVSAKIAKIAPRWPKTAPRRLKMTHHGPKMVPRWSQGVIFAAKMAKIAPTELKTTPKRFRMAHDGCKMAQRWSRDPAGISFFCNSVKMKEHSIELA